MTLPLDPFHAWDNLSADWTFCPDCQLPTTDLREHRKARSCRGIAAITAQWQQGRSMLPLSLKVPTSRTGKYITGAKSSPIAERRRYAHSPLPGVALWDILLLASVITPLTEGTDQPSLAAIRTATEHIETHGRPTLSEQHYLNSFTVRCSHRPYPLRRTHRASSWDYHELRRDETHGLILVDHVNDDRAETFLSMLSGETSDCALIRQWWNSPPDGEPTPVPYKAVWRDVERYNAWRAMDAEPWVIDAWMQVSAGPAEAEAWTQAGYTPWEAYLASLNHVYPTNSDENPYGRPHEWRNIGCDVLEARKWSGMSNQAVRYLFDTRSLRNSPAAVHKPFSPTHAGELRAQHVTYKEALARHGEAQHVWPETSEGAEFRTWCHVFREAQN